MARGKKLTIKLDKMKNSARGSVSRSRLNKSAASMKSVKTVKSVDEEWRKYI